MARKSFNMPSNFSKFPSCECGSKNFSRIKLNDPEGYEGVVYDLICDSCSLIYTENQLGITDETAKEEVLHPNSLIKKRLQPQIEQTVHEMEQRGDKVKRIRMPWEL